MRGQDRARLTARWVAVLGLVWGCSEPPGVDVPGRPGARKTAAVERAERRAFDGAPPIIPHADFAMTCTSCHHLSGMEVEGVGFAPPSPHAGTLGLSAVSFCRQCHVPRRTAERFAGNRFTGLAQDLRRGERLHPLAPPTMPHRRFMRENCVACHSGPAAREEIRTAHPERQRCAQCHVEVSSRAGWRPALDGLAGGG